MSAAVVLDGGLCSTVCLHWALGEYDRVEAIAFRVKGEALPTAAIECAERAGVRLRVIKLQRAHTYSLFTALLAVSTAAHHSLERVILGQRNLNRAQLVALQVAIDHTSLPRVQLCAPLLGEPIATAYALAFNLGTAAVAGATHSTDCSQPITYQQDRKWGYGCGVCPACEERSDAWQAWWH